MMVMKDCLWIISKKELAKTGEVNANLTGNKYLCIVSPNYTRENGYCLRIDTFDNLSEHIESFPNSPFINLIKLSISIRYH